MSLMTESVESRARSHQLLDLVEKRILVVEGGMGSMLYQRGIWIKQSFEAANRDMPHMVRDIHRDYAAAGVDILKTNTYNANRIRLGRFGLAADAAEITRLGVEIAREVVEETERDRGRTLFVAGSIGPLFEEDAREEERRSVYMEQAQTLLDAGVDILLLETFPSIQELEIAVSAVRDRLGEDPALMASLSLSGPDGPLRDVERRGLEDVGSRLERLPAEIIGLNGGDGPDAVREQLRIIAPVITKPLLYMPGIGAPKDIDGRPLPMVTPEYLTVYARRAIRDGARLVGGCSGTTPEHLRSVVGGVRSIQSGGAAVESAAGVEVKEGADKKLVRAKRLPPEEQKSTMAKKLSEGKFLVSVEIDPPHSTDPSKAIKQAQILAESGLVDCINIADGPRASARMDPLSMALLFMRETGMEPIVHYCCRDRNILGMQSDLIGSNAIGVYNTLAITGDPPKLGNYPHATAVYDVDAIGLLKIANNLNNGLDLAGNPIGGHTNLHLGAGANPQREDLDLEIRRFEEKVAAGAEYIMTQPVYDLKIFERFYNRVEAVVRESGVKLLLGILPLASYRNAKFLHENVPGMQVPAPYMERMRKCESKDEARDTGIAIAQEALVECRPMVHGTYIMPPFNNAKAALRVLDVLT